MGIDEWLNPMCAPIAKVYDFEDFPGHSYVLVECELCSARFTGIFKTDYPKVTCPKCNTRGGVKFVSEIRKIYLQ